jgi:hypothetical protein
MSNYQRHQEVAAAQVRQATVNAAKTLAYASGLYDGGWLVECDGHKDGFRNDYCLVHSNPGNLVCHPVYAIRDVEGMDKTGLDEVLVACVKERGEQPSVTLITPDEIHGLKLALKSDYSDHCNQQEAMEEKALSAQEWLDGLLADGLDETSPWATEELAKEISQ